MASVLERGGHGAAAGRLCPRPRPPDPPRCARAPPRRPGCADLRHDARCAPGVRLDAAQRQRLRRLRGVPVRLTYEFRDVVAASVRGADTHHAVLSAARREIRPRGSARIDSAAMRAATIRDGEVLVEEHPDPEPGRRPGARPRARRRAQRRRHAAARGRYPAPPGSPPDIPGLELAGEVAALGAGAARFAEGDRVMGIVGGGGQGELAVVHERQLMPVPDAVGLPDAGGLPEVFTTAHDALFTQARPAARRAAARPRRRGRRRHGRGPARPRGRRARHGDGAQPATRATPSRELGADEVIEPEGFERARPVRRRPRARRRAEPRREPQGAEHGRPDRRDRHRRRRQGRAQPRRAHGQARRASWPRRCAPARWRRRPRRRARWSARCCRCSSAARCGCRSPRRSRSTTSPPPTSASRPAASSARSS